MQYESHRVMLLLKR